MRIRYYIAFGPCEEVEGAWLGLRYREDAHRRQLPFIVIKLTAEVVINNRRLRAGQELYGDVLSVYTEVNASGDERILWSPRENLKVMMTHHLEFLAQHPDYPDLDNLDPAQAARRKVSLRENFDEKKSRKASGKGKSRKAAARTSSKKSSKKGKGRRV